MTELELRRQIIATALRMNELRVNRGRSGNVSARTRAGFLVTPTGLPYAETRRRRTLRQWRLTAMPAGRGSRRPNGAFTATSTPRGTMSARSCTRTRHSRRRSPAWGAASPPSTTWSRWPGARTYAAPIRDVRHPSLSDRALAALDGRNACLLANHGMVAVGALAGRRARTGRRGRSAGRAVLARAANGDAEPAVRRGDGRRAGEIQELRGEPRLPLIDPGMRDTFPSDFFAIHSSVRRRLLIEGWRSIHHSYALVAQAHCLCMLRKNDIDLRFRDVPYGNRTWRRTSGLFGPDEEAAIASIAAPEPAFVPEVTLTMHAGGPKLGIPASGRKFVFGTPGFRVVRQEALGGFRRGNEIPEVIHFLTPSRWTAVAYERFGVPLNRIHVVPLGIDPEVFRPDETERLAMRSKLGISDHFVFLSTGSMTMVKGIDLLSCPPSRA